ncbi:hypothetical protein [Sorangium sp. So ce887]|uniref:hypothetical protein n=1 Tax=Sorangium sp. So ce887 TaxID=3133324 RepID=UPI003F62459F
MPTAEEITKHQYQASISAIMSRTPFLHVPPTANDPFRCERPWWSASCATVVQQTDVLRAALDMAATSFGTGR